MKIVIEHCRYTPKWDTLQQMLREATADESATITRINRPDRQCGYREPGIYEIDVRRDNNTILPVTLEVVAVGHKPTILIEGPHDPNDTRSHRRTIP